MQGGSSRLIAKVASASLIPLWFFTAYVVVAVSALSFWSATIVSVLTLSCAIALVFLRFTASGRKLFRSRIRHNSIDAVNAFVMLVALTTAGFGAAAVSLNYPIVHSAALHRAAALHLANRSYEHFLWNLADAIPVLKIPTTLDWKLQDPFKSPFIGALTLTYKLVVVSPFLYALSQLTLRFKPEEESAEKATDD